MLLPSIPSSMLRHHLSSTFCFCLVASLHLSPLALLPNKAHSQVKRGCSSCQLHEAAIFTLRPSLFHATNHLSKREQTLKLLPSLLMLFSCSLLLLSQAHTRLCENLTLVHFGARSVGNRSDQSPQRSEASEAEGVTHYAGGSELYRGRLFRIATTLCGDELLIAFPSHSCFGRLSETCRAFRFSPTQLLSTQLLCSRHIAPLKRALQ